MSNRSKGVFVAPFFAFFILQSLICHAQQKGIYSGVPWFDSKRQVVSAHGGAILKENGRFYFFGEKHNDSTNVFAGFNCYSSADLYNWKFEGIALARQDSGRLGPNRVGERVKVMKCPKTGEYVMFMHSDDMAYKDPCITYATSKNINGPYTFHGPLFFNGSIIKKWDMGTFQDDDGSGYLLTHSGFVYKLNDDYKSVSSLLIKDFAPGSEAPAVFKKDGVYFWLASHLSGWERNDNFYYTAPSMAGPWTYRGLFAPQGSLTYNSQTTFVLPVAGSKQTTFLFMGDRWSFPHQTSAATYVWQPLVVKGTSVSMPQYMPCWQIDLKTGSYAGIPIDGELVANDSPAIQYSGQWQNRQNQNATIRASDAKGDKFSIMFKGSRIGLYGLLNNDGGYANILIRDFEGNTLVNTTIDMYCAYPDPSLIFLSPVLWKTGYTLTVTVAGEHWSWTDKKKNVTGSKGNVVNIGKAIIIK